MGSSGLNYFSFLQIPVAWPGKGVPPKQALDHPCHHTHSALPSRLGPLGQTSPDTWVGSKILWEHSCVQLYMVLSSYSNRAEYCRATKPEIFTIWPFTEIIFPSVTHTLLTSTCLPFPEEMRLISCLGFPRRGFFRFVHMANSSFSHKAQCRHHLLQRGSCGPQIELNVHEGWGLHMINAFRTLTHCLIQSRYLISGLDLCTRYPWFHCAAIRSSHVMANGV